MNNEISFQQLRAPIAVALTVILNSMFALPSDARLTDLSKVESPLILASILFIFPLAIWNHPPSLAASGTTLLILSLLAHSHRGTYGDFEQQRRAERPLSRLQDSMVLRRPAPGSGARLRRQKARTLNPLAGIRMEVHPPPRTTH